MKPALFAVLVLVFGVATAFTWRARSATREARLALDAVVQQSSATAAAIPPIEAEQTTRTRENDALRALLTQAAVPARKASSAAAPTSLAELERKIAASRSTAPAPADQLLGIAARRVDVKAMHLEFFARRGLSPAQIDQFVALSQKRFEADIDLSALVKQGVVGAEDPVVEKWRAETKFEQDAGFRALLGEDGFEELQEQWRMTNATEMMKGFAAIAAIYGAQLSRTQLDQLVQVANADSTYRAGGAVDFDGVDWDRVDAEVRPVLTEAQWAMFQNLGSGMSYNWAYSRAGHAINKAKLAGGREEVKGRPNPSIQSRASRAFVGCSRVGACDSGLPWAHPRDLGCYAAVRLLAVVVAMAFAILPGLTAN